MIFKDKAVTCVLTAIAPKLLDEEVVTSFNLRHVETGEIQTFLNNLEEKTDIENVKCLFNFPVQWKNILIEVNRDFEIEFDELEFDAALTEIRVARSWKEGVEYFTYDMKFIKEVETDTDAIFAHMLNRKEYNADGKKVLVDYGCYFKNKVELTKGESDE